MAEHETEPASRRRGFPQPLPKHTIFLSHSGNEKAFVEQLCEDLKGMNHFPFFDQDSDSLPKGERFPSLIFSAAENCMMAVVVLSEGYLTSKWPMLELSTFVKSMKGGPNPSLKLLPVFYKLLPSDLSAEEVETKWKESWKKLVEEEKVSAEEIASWSDAVRELRAWNGLEFRKYGTSEVKYRAAVVEEICSNVPPMMKYKTDDIRGYERLCEITSKLFEEGTSEVITCTEGCYYLGIYGLGGVGKSTLCKAMCNYFQEYGMRVCHVELPSNAEEELPSAAEKGRISRLKFVIQELANFGTRIVDRITSESQGLEWLQNQLKGQAPVFLVVDNVGDFESSRDKARGLVKTVLANGSKVMVTSRSRAILKSIFHTEKYCKPISRLEAHEARELFLSVAAPKRLLCPLQSFEDDIVKACLRECQFAEDGYALGQYHPLVLRALGSYFHDVDEDNIMEWKEHLSVQKKLQGSRDSKRVNDILGLNYYSLLDEDKLIFLDVALLLNVRFASVYGMSFIDIAGSDMEVKDYKWRVSFIASLHGIFPLEAGRKIKELQRKSLIYEASPTLEMHDLYRDFAQLLVTKVGSREREWWVHSKNSAVGMDLSLMKRLRLDGGEAKILYNPEQLQQCEKLECLVMVGCHTSENFILDMWCLKSLRVLILKNVRGMVEIQCSWKGPSWMGDEGCLPQLCFVQLFGTNLKQIPFIIDCYNLKSLSIELREKSLVDSIQSEICKMPISLEVLRLRYSLSPSFESLLESVSCLQSLKILFIDISTFKSWPRFPQRKVDLSALGCLPSLQALSLRLPRYFAVEGLHRLSRLTTLELNCSHSMFEGLDQLSQLTILDLEGCRHLCLLPNLDVLPNLREVCINGCCSLEGSIQPLKNYQEIKHHNYHECHQPFCNQISCNFCTRRHGRLLLLSHLEVHCGICNHMKEYPRGCPSYDPGDSNCCLACVTMFSHNIIIRGSETSQTAQDRRPPRPDRYEPRSPFEAVVNRVSVRLDNEPVPRRQRSIGTRLLPPFGNRHFGNQK